VQLIQKAFKRNKLLEKSATFDLTVTKITKLDPIEYFKENLAAADAQ
jgi:hypothetical protein